MWETDSTTDLKFAAAQLLETAENDLAEISDYDLFSALTEMYADENVISELEKLKAETLANMPSQSHVQKAEKADEQKQEQSAVNAPEKVVAAKKEPKSGTPYTYHFNEKNIVTGGAKAKFKANVEAIQTLRKIEAENRYATPEEYAAARASTLTSFYTPPEIADGVYQALEQFGFEGGNVLEPSIGVGNFFSKMPEKIRDNSRLYGVELDSISGRIAQQLHPNERIQIKGFEQTNFNNNSFDVVVGNIPFGDYKVTDRNYDKLNFKIHDYFAAKSVDKVKPGGVVALVTSKFTIDKKSEKVRRYLAERCDLLGAVRLQR